MRTPFIASPGQLAELNKVLLAVRTPTNQFVSRTAIDEEVIRNPGTYPQLSELTDRFRKHLITTYMKQRLPVWGGSTSSKKGSYVWIISENQEVPDIYRGINKLNSALSARDIPSSQNSQVDIIQSNREKRLLTSLYSIYHPIA